MAAVIDNGELGSAELCDFARANKVGQPADCPALRHDIGFAMKLSSAWRIHHQRNRMPNAGTYGSVEANTQVHPGPTRENVILDLSRVGGISRRAKLVSR